LNHLEGYKFISKEEKERIEKERALHEFTDRFDGDPKYKTYVKLK